MDLFWHYYTQQSCSASSLWKMPDSNPGPLTRVINDDEGLAGDPFLRVEDAVLLTDLTGAVGQQGQPAPTLQSSVRPKTNILFLKNLGPLGAFLHFWDLTLFVASASMSIALKVTHPSANPGPSCWTSVFLRVTGIGVSNLVLPYLFNLILLRGQSRELCVSWELGIRAAVWSNNCPDSES